MRGAERPLTIKRERFCREMALHGNAAAAYRNAYECKNMSNKSIAKEANRLKNEPEIEQRIAELMEEDRKRYKFDKDSTIDFLAKVLGFSLNDLLITDEKTGESRFRTPEEIPTATKEIIQQVEETKDGKPRYKMYSKIKAIEQLTNLMGWEPPKQVEVSTRERNVIRIGFDNED